MPAREPSAGSTVVPALRYRDIGRAIDWLCAAFGFERHAVAEDEDGVVQFAQLTLGNGMIMLAPVADTDLDRLMAQPDQIGGLETRFCYFVVDDADAHCARARAVGAEIVLPLKDFDDGGRGYSARDLEGRIWSFGTHDPWAGRPPPGAPRAKTDEMPSSSGSGVRLGAIFGGLLATTVIAAAAVWINAAHLPTPGPDPTAGLHKLQEQLAEERAARERAVRAAQTLGEQLAEERRQKEAAEQAAAKASGDLAKERQAAHDSREQLMRAEKERQEALRAAGQRGAEVAAKEAAEKAAADKAAAEAREALARESTARLGAERTAAELRSALDRERGLRERAEQAAGEGIASEGKAREDAERTARAAQDELARERTSRQEAERVAKELQEQLAAARREAEAESQARQATPPARAKEAPPAGKQPQRTANKKSAPTGKAARKQKAEDPQVYEFLQPPQPLPSAQP